MIEVTYHMPEPGGTYSLTVTGHAEYEDDGFDAVCASISTLIYTLAQNRKDADGLGYLRRHPTLKLEDGDARVKARPLLEKEALIAMMFTVVVRGVELIAKNYPLHVCLVKMVPVATPTK